MIPSYSSIKINESISKGNFDKLIQEYLVMNEENKINFIKKIKRNNYDLFYSAYFNILKKDNFTLNENNIHQILTTKEMFIAYLKTYPNETTQVNLKRCSDEVLNKIICDLNPNKKGFEILKKIGFVKITSMQKNNNFDFVIDLSTENIIQLCEIYKTNIFIKQLAKYNYSNFTSFFLDLKNHLKAINYSTTNGQILFNGLLDYLLKLDYQKTISLIEKSYPLDWQALMHYCDIKSTAEILKDNHFCFDKETSDCLKHCYPFFLASLEEDTIKTLHYYSSWQTTINNELQFNYINDNYLKNIRLEDLPKCLLLQDKILSQYIKNEDQINLIKEIISSDNYSKTIENKLLNFFNNKYESLEEIIINMHKENKTRNKMSIFEILTIQVYVQKYALEIEIKPLQLNMFTYSDSLGSFCSNNSIPHIEICNKNLSIEQILYTVFHELMHAKQHYDLQTLNLFADIDVYCKDLFLSHMDSNYYTQNYVSINSEYNADFNGYMKTIKLLNIEDDTFKYYKNSVKKQQIQQRKNLSYCYEMYRKVACNQKKAHINDLMEKYLTIFLNANEKSLDIINNNFPIIAYEYNLNSITTPKRKTIKELISALNNCTSSKDINVYLYLLKSRFNIEKEKKEDIKHSNKELMKILKKESLDDYLKNILPVIIKSQKKDCHF